MKKTLAILLFLCFVSTIASAQNCKYTVDKVDPISGKRVLSMKVGIGYWYNISFGRIGNEYWVESVIYMPGVQNFIVSAGTPIDIKLANDKIVTVGSSSDAAPVSYISGTQVYSIYLMSYPITEAQAKSIAASGIKYTKNHLTAEKYYEHMYKDKETEKTQHAAICAYNAGTAAPAAKTSTTTATKTAKEKEDDSLIESMMRKKQEKKAKDEAVEKAKTEPAPIKPQPATTPAPAASTPAAAMPPALKPAAAPAANTSSQSQIIVPPLSGADELMKWKKLLDQGIITKEEFEVQKKKILEK